jgi:hypothetical protein
MASLIREREASAEASLFSLSLLLECPDFTTDYLLCNAGDTCKLRVYDSLNVLADIRETTVWFHEYLNTGDKRLINRFTNLREEPNINLFNNGSFTVSLGALRSIMYGKDKYAFVMRIPDQSVQLSKMKKLAQDQRQISSHGIIFLFRI